MRRYMTSCARKYQRHRLTAGSAPREVIEEYYCELVVPLAKTIYSHRRLEGLINRLRNSHHVPVQTFPYSAMIRS